ncbi:DNA repair protein RadA [Flavihumibacter stibioxidans]|uniref:DNA repair protein RadA n=1 Tax=Flavihumibacter stibioxidans TaxID=1834163 RepID=A0ABR7M9F0_9BACT|nr:DNA repair protein RadA [Flavihumibacter stibioxidans]MBC6491658.1 DNA repair protein RadA [Flavihumibacter stibioxidans]
MSKIKSSFFCQQCGYESAKWLGKCPACQQWNTFVEEIKQTATKQNATPWQSDHKSSKPGVTRLQDISVTKENRIITPDTELNRVLGGGIVAGSIVLVAGEPGIGKSTLFLQIGLQLQQIRVLYVSGEESEQQIRMRAERLAFSSEEFYLLTETNTQQIFQEIKKLKPDLVIIDSIQTLHTSHIESSPGSVSQIRECAAELQRFAKESNTPVFLIGHITKDGAIAGPKILEHMVDTVLQFEGDRHYAYRILRTLKNRFGSTAELGIYEMSSSGMKGVLNPSDILLSHKEEQLSGIAIAATIEGMRPFLIEVQALVTPSVYGTPQRTVSGFDLRRLQLLLAVLEKRGGFQFGTKDVFLNIAGGLKVEDPAIDLSVLCALLSSYTDIPVPHTICFAGEVGLSGEIRSVNRIEQRIAEAEKLGFEKILISRYNQKGMAKTGSHIEVVPVSRVEDVYRLLF